MTISKSDIKQLAHSRGGTCIGLSSGNGYLAKYVWRCSKGHTWEATFASVNSGSWCLQCSRDKQKNTIEEMQTLATKLGGKCLSPNYVNAHTKLKWQCLQGHHFEATPAHVKHGRWCRICGNKRAIAGRTTTISEIQALATARKGKCLSGSYTPGMKLKWQCEHSHIWEAELHNVKSGKWCPVCGHRRAGRKRRLSIEEMRNIAHSYGGRCLSTSYQNTDFKLQWECSEGHTWLAIPSSVKKGHWCAECAGNNRLRIEDAQALAHARGGECLSDEYHSNHDQLRWQCSEGHTWMAQYSNIASGNWCPECSVGIGERICRAYFEQMFVHDFPKTRPHWLVNSDGYQMELDGCCEDLGIAFEHQGRQHYQEVHFFHSKGQFSKRTRDDARKRLLCREHSITLIEIPQIPNALPLSQIQQYIIDQCTAQGIHLPEAVASIKVELVRAYAPDARERLNLIQRTASMHGGKCLSPAYLGIKVPLRFRCSDGHEWETIPEVILKGHWCPKCSASKRGHANRLGLPEMQSIAESRGGRCLSQEYVDANTHLLWQCGVGHQWKATPHNIKRGRWCPICSKRVVRV